MHRLKITAALLLGGLMGLAAITANAQTYPNKQIRWIVPYTPGGITDNVTRLITIKVAEALGQSIVIENRPGANSIIGAEIVARAAPDGYTFGTVIAAHAANATLYQGKLPFDAVKSFQPVALAGISPLVMSANNAFPANTVPELITYAKANPGKVKFGSSGVGAAAHLTMELLKQMSGTEMIHVPYKGTAPALQALTSGEIQILIDAPSALVPQIRSKTVKGLAMLAKSRVIGADEIPTITETGGPDIESSTWLLFLAPAGTPKEIVDRVATEVRKATNSPDLKARFDQLSVIAGTGGAAEAEAFLAAEIARWAKVITTAGVKADE